MHIQYRSFTFLVTHYLQCNGECEYCLTLSAAQDVCNVTLFLWRIAPRDVSNVTTTKTKFLFFARHTFLPLFHILLTFGLISMLLGKKFIFFFIIIIIFQGALNQIRFIQIVLYRGWTVFRSYLSR